MIPSDALTLVTCFENCSLMLASLLLFTAITSLLPCFDVTDLFSLGIDWFHACVGSLVYWCIYVACVYLCGGALAL